MDLFHGISYEKFYISLVKFQTINTYVAAKNGRSGKQSFCETV